MQQVLNVLLGNTGQSKGGNNTDISTNELGTSDGTDFSVYIEKNNIDHGVDVKSAADSDTALKSDAGTKQSSDDDTLAEIVEGESLLFRIDKARQLLGGLDSCGYLSTDGNNSIAITGSAEVGISLPPQDDSSNSLFGLIGPQAGNASSFSPSCVTHSSTSLPTASDVNATLGRSLEVGEESLQSLDAAALQSLALLNSELEQAIGALHNETDSTSKPLAELLSATQNAGVTDDALLAAEIAEDIKASSSQGTLSSRVTSSDSQLFAPHSERIHSAKSPMVKPSVALEGGISLPADMNAEATADVLSDIDLTTSVSDSAAAADATKGAAEELMRHSSDIKAEKAENTSIDKRDIAATLTRAVGETSQAVAQLERTSADVQRVEQPSAQSLDPRLNALHQRPEPLAVNLSLRRGNERPSMADIVARFSPVMNNQLIAMVRDGVQQAEIRLDPPELGSMMVRIQVQGNETQVQFHVTATQTKDVVEQAMPRLRELLAQQGMSLTDGQVSHDKGQGSGRDSDTQQSAGGFVDEIQAEDMPLSVNQTTSYVSGIDYYA